MEVKKDPIFSTHSICIYFIKTFHVKCLKRNLFKRIHQHQKSIIMHLARLVPKKKDKCIYIFMLFYNLILFANCCELHYLNFSISHESNEWIHIIMVFDPNQFTFSVFYSSHFFVLLNIFMQYTLDYHAVQNCIIFYHFFNIAVTVAAPRVVSLRIKIYHLIAIIKWKIEQGHWLNNHFSMFELSLEFGKHGRV